MSILKKTLTEALDRRTRGAAGGALNVIGAVGNRAGYMNRAGVSMAAPAAPKATGALAAAAASTATTLGKVQGGGTLANMAVGAFGGGMVGYSTGNQDAKSFIGGAVAGAAFGGLARPLMHSSMKFTENQLFAQAKSVNSTVAAGRLSGLGQKIRGARTAFESAMGTRAGRRMAYSGGAMLAGGTFSGMFMGGNRTNRRRGFNSHRGNSF